MIRRLLLAVLVGCSSLAGAPPEPQAVTFAGAGATFPYPLYSKWIAEYTKLHPDVRINYQSIGSGGGIHMIADRTGDGGFLPLVHQ